MNTHSALNVNVRIPADGDLRLLDEVLDSLRGQRAQVDIYLDSARPSADLHAQINHWLAAVYAREQLS